jgi:hypothetical protein
VSGSNVHGSPTLTSGLSTHGARRCRDWTSLEILRREPPFWGLGGAEPADGGWHLELDDSLERYADVAGIGDYVAAVQERLDEANAGCEAVYGQMATQLTAAAPTAPPVAKPFWKQPILWVGTFVVAGVLSGTSGAIDDGVKAGWALLAGWIRHRLH